jgi:hypothetical protein
MNRDQRDHFSLFVVALVITLLVLAVAFQAHGADPDPEAPSEIEALRKQIVALDDRIARLETLTGLLMAAYQAEVKRKALELPEPPPPSPELQEVRP